MFNQKKMHNERRGPTYTAEQEPEKRESLQISGIEHGNSYNLTSCFTVLYTHIMQMHIV